MEEAAGSIRLRQPFGTLKDADVLIMKRIRTYQFTRAVWLTAGAAQTTT